MDQYKNVGTIIAVIVIIIALWWWFCRDQKVVQEEYFNSYGKQYGLRGDLLRTSSIDKIYMSPYRQIRLSDSGADMWTSDYTPVQQGMKGCHKTRCPKIGDYDNRDTCWQCKTKKIIPGCRGN
jgi:hypothetical protein